MQEPSPMPQCLFPPEAKPGLHSEPAISLLENSKQLLEELGTKNGPAAAQIQLTVNENESEPDLLATVCSVLLPTFITTEVQDYLCPPVAQAAQALLRSLAAGWLLPHEFEEVFLKFFAQCDASAALINKPPSPVGCTSDGSGAQDVTASARVTECLCVQSPTPPDDTRAPRCLQAYSAPTECSLERQVINSCRFLD